MAAAGDATRVEVTFVAGPLGLGLAESRRVVKVTEGGAADTLGVRVGDVLLVVGDRDVSGLAYEEVLAHIKAAPRPVRLLRRPEPIEALAPVPDDPPVSFRWRGARHRVRRAEGPERLAPEWWRPDHGATRDYYRVEDETGARFWLFRAGLYGADPPPRWWLHGLFG